MRSIDLVVVETGTLVRDDEAVATALIEALGVHGAALSTGFEHDYVSFVEHTRGLAILSVLRSLLGDEEHALDAHATFEIAFPSVLAQGGAQPVSGAAEAIAALRQAGHRVGVMSRLSQRCVDALVDSVGWRDMIDVAVGPCAGVRTAPQPDLVLTAIMGAGITAVHSVAVVADSANALVAGTRAGAPSVIGVLSGARVVAEFECVPHTHTVERVSDLPHLVEVIDPRARAA